MMMPPIIIAWQQKEEHSKPDMQTCEDNVVSGKTFIGCQMYLIWII